MHLSNNEMSSFLMYRMTRPLDTHTIAETFPARVPVCNSQELEKHLKERVIVHKELILGETA